MKKILLTVILILTVLCLFACTGKSATVDQSWAKSETLSYSIYDSNLNNALIGDARFTTKTNLTDEDKATLPSDLTGFASGANTMVTSNITVAEKYYINTVFFANVYRVLTYVRRYVDVNDNTKDYVLKAYHEGKYYHYTINYPNDENKKDVSGKLKVGDSGYTEHEFLYYYIRCYAIGNVPSSIKVADPFSGTINTVSCSSGAEISVVTESATLGTVPCNSVTVTNAKAPVGRGLTVYYLPDNASYTYGEGTIIKSKKLPTKIVENNLTYVLKNFSAGNGQNDQ